MFWKDGNRVIGGVVFGGTEARLGRDEAGGHALSFINLDSWPDDDVLTEPPAVEKAMVVEL